MVVIRALNEESQIVSVYEEGKNSYGTDFRIERIYRIAGGSSKFPNGCYSMSLFKENLDSKDLFAEVFLTYENLDQLIIKLQELRDKRK